MALPIIAIEHIRLAVFFVTKRSTLLIGDDLIREAICQVRVCQRTSTNADEVGLPIDHSKIEPRIGLIAQRCRSGSSRYKNPGRHLLQYQRWLRTCRHDWD